MNSVPDRRARFEAVADVVIGPVDQYLRRRAPAHDAQDVLAETLLVVWRRLDQVPVDDPLPWTYGVARRCLANHRRGDQRRGRLTDRLRGTERRTAADPADLVGESDPALSAAIGLLSASEAEIVRLWAWEQLEPREIAAALDMTANAVSVALTRAKRKLSAELDRQDPPPSGHRPGTDQPTKEGNTR